MFGVKIAAYYKFITQRFEEIFILIFCYCVFWRLVSSSNCYVACYVFYFNARCLYVLGFIFIVFKMIYFFTYYYGCSSMSCTIWVLSVVGFISRYFKITSVGEMCFRH